MQTSLIKYGHARASFHCPRTDKWDSYRHWFSTLYVYQNLVLERVSAKNVSNLTTTEQKKLHLKILQDMLNFANTLPHPLKTNFTGDKVSVYKCDNTGRKAVVTVERLNISEAIRSTTDTQQYQKRLTIFLNSHRVVLGEYTPQGQNLDLLSHL